MGTERAGSWREGILGSGVHSLLGSKLDNLFADFKRNIQRYPNEDTNP